MEKRYNNSRKETGSRHAAHSDNSHRRRDEQTQRNSRPQRNNRNLGAYNEESDENTNQRWQSSSDNRNSKRNTRQNWHSSDRDNSYGTDAANNRKPDNRRNNKSNRNTYSKQEARNSRTQPNTNAQQKSNQAPTHEEGLTRLNKYISNAGICSRREADTLIAAGSVTVNGKVITEMGYKVKPGDVVNYGGETLRSERKRYFLLNKPKGFITTADDPQERQTVMMLIDGACNERIYPVGRLDRNTTGLLLFTNDGDLAKKLTHPSTGVYKIYHVELNKPVTREDMKRMLDGIELEDGPIHVDDVQYVENANDKRIVGVELHSGRNRIVRRIFEHLGYEVHKLDRVVFAGLTKKDLPRGRYRELTEKEIGFLKMI